MQIIDLSNVTEQDSTGEPIFRVEDVEREAAGVRELELIEGVPESERRRRLLEISDERVNRLSAQITELEARLKQSEGSIEELAACNYQLGVRATEAEARAESLQQQVIQLQQEKEALLERNSQSAR